MILLKLSDEKEEIKEANQDISIDNKNTLEEVVDLEKNIDNQSLEIVRDLKVTDNTEEIKKLENIEDKDKSNKLEETGELEIVDANIDNIELENEKFFKRIRHIFRKGYNFRK